MVPLQVSAVKAAATDGKEAAYLLELNGRRIDESRVWDRDDGLAAKIWDDEQAIEDLLAYSPSELEQQFQSISVLHENSPDHIWIWVKVVLKPYPWERGHSIRFEINYDIEEWANPWSITDFDAAVKRITEDLNDTGIVASSEDENPVSGTVVDFLIDRTAETCASVFAPCARVFDSILEKSLMSLLDGIETRSVTTRFKFPDHLRVACEQYLLYFGQFLEDLGLDGRAEIKQQAGETLFRITPNSGPEALRKIREALDVYLTLPFETELNDGTPSSSEVALLQLSAQIHHLKSQALLAQAVLQARDSQIEALQAATFFYRQRLEELEQDHKSLVGPTESEVESVQILGGFANIDRYRGNGFTVNSPKIVQWLTEHLKRRWPKR